jgi:VIT1/CCC1 family predicted Fe2+/Mn2+ transporter
MLGLLAEKFIKDPAALKRLKEMISVGVIFDMMQKDIQEEIQEDTKVEIAKNMLKDGVGISVISKYTGLSEPTVRNLKAELDNEPEQNEAAAVV